MTSDEQRRHLAGLPHGREFTFVRELVSCEAGTAAECATSFSADDPVLAGHFPGNPLLPGVILTEALAQTAGIAAASGYPDGARPLFLLSAIRSMKFARAVRPREEIQLCARKIGEMGDLLQFRVEARIGAERVATGEIVLAKTPPQ